MPKFAWEEDGIHVQGCSDTEWTSTLGRGNDGKGKLITCKVFEQRNMLGILGDFPGGPVVKNLPSDAGNGGLIPD